MTKITVYTLFSFERIPHWDGESEWYGYSQPRRTRFRFSSLEAAEKMAKLLMAVEDDKIYEVQDDDISFWDSVEDAMEDPYIANTLLGDK